MFFCAQALYAFSHLHRAPSHVLGYPTGVCDHMVIFSLVATVVAMATYSIM
jgi:hypothetical protein